MLCGYRNQGWTVPTTIDIGEIVMTNFRDLLVKILLSSRVFESLVNDYFLFKSTGIKIAFFFFLSHILAGMLHCGMIDRVYVQPIRHSGQTICFFHSACLRTSPVLFFVIGSESINRLVYVSCICLNVMCGFFCASHKSSIADDQPTFLQAHRQFTNNFVQKAGQ